MLKDKRSIKDALTKEHHAKALARRIEDYWHGKGYRWIRAWVERRVDPVHHWILRSNIRFSACK